MKRITILLADDHTIVREGFRKMFETEADFEVVGEAQDGRQAVALALKLSPDMVLMDIAMPGLNGLEATRRLLETMPATRVLILSAHSDDAYVESATEAGAAGFLLKRNSAQDVTQAIRKVHQGETYFSPCISRHFSRLKPRSLNRVGLHRKAARELTSREREVLQMIAEGRTNKGTADELGISIKTVEKHRANLMEKLGIRDTAGLTRYAINAGVIESSVRVIILQ
jgi:DNA-binding NarL/FixJ family response regulator